MSMRVVVRCDEAGCQRVCVSDSLGGAVELTRRDGWSTQGELHRCWEHHIQSQVCAKGVAASRSRDVP